jgi:MFS family permease
VAETASVKAGGWRDLLGRDHAGASTVLAGGVALYATNEFVTISLMPSAVAEVGGHRFYAWVTTVYLVGSVVAATTVGLLLQRRGPRWSYLFGLGVFGAGSMMCALAPTMVVLLVGRTVQGVAGGLLAGLGYAVINAVLPNMLWTRASALVSAMWGVGTVIGPASGGLFAQFGLWRWAFGLLVVGSIAIAALVPMALPRGAEVPHREPAGGLPVVSLMLLGAAALLVSIAGIPRSLAVTSALLGLGVVVVVVVVFVVVDRRAAVGVLPPSTFGPGPLKWIYLTLGALMVTAMVDVYVPLFGQRLADLTPLAAGFLAAGLAIGWTVSEIASASLTNRRTIERVVTVAPLAVASGLALMALTPTSGGQFGVVAFWSLGLLVAGGGIGSAWPHLSVWAMSCVEDPSEGPVAAAAINTVQLVSGALGAGLAGAVVNTTDVGGASAARWLFALFAVVAAVACAASARAMRGVRLHNRALKSQEHQN